MSKTIYVIGDSFSAGSELEDNTFPSYNQCKPKDKSDYYKWIASKEYKNDFNLKPAGYSKYYAEMKRAWPAKLEAITDTRVINRAHGGSGPAMWRARVMTDLLHFKNDGIKIDTAIIQIHAYDRDCLFDIGENNTIYNNIGLTKLKYGTGAEKAYFKIRLMLESTYGNFYRFLIDVANMKASFLSFGITDIKIIVSDSTSVFYDWKQLEFINHPDIKPLLDYLEFDLNTPSCVPSIWDYGTHEGVVTKLPMGHYPEFIHDEFAHKMKTILNL